MPARCGRRPFSRSSRQPYGCSTHRPRWCCWESCFLRTGKKFHLTLAAAGFAAAIGVFDAVTWDGGLFHSYVTNIRFNLILGAERAGESPAYQFLLWLTLAGLGLSLLCLAGALRRPRRYGFLLGLIALVLLLHSLQAHKEYRFIFAVIPLWLLIGADLAARLAAREDGLRRLAKLSAAGFAAVSLAGILNALPYQDRVYRAWSKETGAVGFVRNQDPIFPAYRYLARAPGVNGVWQVDRRYHGLPAYYYLHKDIPFYDASTGRGLRGNVEAVLFPGQSHRVREPRLLGSRLLPGARIRPRAHLAPRPERTASATMVGPRPRHCDQSQ